jgi:nucleotide-binding universal stress UspA family protein
MQTHIVVPSDGSSLAETILPHASALARASSAKVTLLRVIPPVTSLGLMGVELPEHWFDEEVAWSQNYLADVARQLTDEGGIHVQTEVLDGDPATEIVTYKQKKHDVTLVAMATHGLSGGHRWLLGSVASKVLHVLPTSLLLFHPQGKAHRQAGPVSYQTILVPLDGTRVAEQALDEAKSIASRMKATLLLLSVMPVSQESAAYGYLEREAERVPCAAALIKMLQKADCRDDKFAVIIDKYITLIILTCLNFNHAHGVLLLSLRGKSPLVSKIEHMYSIY